MKKLILALLLLAGPAFGQVKQSGNVTPGHAVVWTTTGVIQDGGNAAIGGLTSIGVTTSGAGICQNSGPVSGAYNQLCFNVTQSGGGVFSLNNYNGASGGLLFSLNGTTQGLGIVALPVTVNDAACIANSSGNLKDCGVTPSNPCSTTGSAIQYESSSTTFGCIANWTSDGSNIISNRTTANLQFETTGNNAFLWAAASQTLAIGSGANNSGGGLWLGSISLRSNLVSSAWTTSGIRYANVPVTLTDTSSSGTVTTAYTNVFGGDTIAALSATTYTNYYGTYFNNPVAGTNATLTNSWALGADSALINGNLKVTGTCTGCGSPGGSNTQLQYNNSSALGGISGATSNGTDITVATGDLFIGGSSTGTTAIASANASATNYTATLQAASGTLAYTSQLVPVGGSNSDVQYNSSGTLGGTGNFTYVDPGQLSLALGIITANAKAISITGTWNNSGVLFDAPFFMNITATAETSQSRLLDLQLGGTSVFNVADLSGGAYVSILNASGANGVTLNGLSGNVYSSGLIGVVDNAASPGTYYFLVRSTSSYLINGIPFGWSSNPAIGSADADIGLSRPSAGVLAVGNGSQGDETGIIIAASHQSSGSSPTLTTGSCSGSSAAGGATAGTFTAATCAAGTYILSALPAAPHGYACDAYDRTTVADTLVQTASSTTSATFKATTASSDIVQFKCMGY